jgi:hypothetical protein
VLVRAPLSGLAQARSHRARDASDQATAAVRRPGIRAVAGAVLVGLCSSAAALAAAPALMPPSYSWISHTMSESAAQGVSGAWLARLGFLLLGLSVMALAFAATPDWGALVGGLALRLRRFHGRGRRVLDPRVDRRTLRPHRGCAAFGRGDRNGFRVRRRRGGGRAARGPEAWPSTPWLSSRRSWCHSRCPRGRLLTGHFSGSCLLSPTCGTRQPPSTSSEVRHPSETSRLGFGPGAARSTRDVVALRNDETNEEARDC